MQRDQKNTAIYIAYDDYEPLDLAQPEKNLLKAILLTAMADIRKSGLISRRAMEYFLSPEDDYLFSFRSVCGFLEVDPDKILKVLGLRNGPGLSVESGRETVQ